MSFNRNLFIYNVIAVLILWAGTLYGEPVEHKGIEHYENIYDGKNINEYDESDPETLNRNAVTSKYMRWPDRVIPYRVENDFNEQERQTVDEALQVFNERTCLTFRQYDEKTDRGRRYIYYRKSPNMCGTRVGYQSVSFTGNSHDVQLAPGCMRRGVIQHETLHALGLYHEQSRPDRDGYVKIDYDNIPQKYWPQFRAQSKSTTTTYDVPYDYTSIMHYSKNAFAKDPSKPTIRAIVNGEVIEQQMGQLNGPTDNDLAKVHYMYKCNE